MRLLPAFAGAVIATALFSSASAATYQLTVSAGSNSGHIVYPTMFGTNVVYNKLTPAQWPTFLATMEALGMTTLRYPGGTVTESDFNFRDSDGPGDDAISLTMFLNGVHDHGFTPILVVPTKPFRNDLTLGASEARAFVKAVNVDHGISGGEQFGTTQTVELWEIGNEYYANKAGGALSATLYGQIAEAWGPAMKAADSSIVPVIQFDRANISDIDTIAAPLSAGSVGACVTHTYPGVNQTISNVTTQIENGVGRYATNGFNLEPMVTEWNMGSDTDSGMVLANYIPQVLSALVAADNDNDGEADVKIATQWPLMWFNNSVNTLLAENDGTLRPPGQIFQWLSDCASNRRTVPTSSSNASAISCVAFRGNGVLRVLVLCGNSASGVQTSLTINGTNWSNPTLVQALRYSVEDNEVVTSNVPAHQRTVSPLKNNNVLYFTTNLKSQYEVLRFDFTN